MLLDIVSSLHDRISWLVTQKIETELYDELRRGDITEQVRTNNRVLSVEVAV